MIKGHLEMEFWGVMQDTRQLLEFFERIPETATVVFDTNKASIDYERWTKITADWNE